MRFVCETNPDVASWLSIADPDGLDDNLERADEKLLLVTAGQELDFSNISQELRAVVFDVIAMTPQTRQPNNPKSPCEAMLGNRPGEISINAFLRNIRKSVTSRIRIEPKRAESAQNFIKNSIGRVSPYADKVTVYDRYALNHLSKTESLFFREVIQNSTADVEIWTCVELGNPKKIDKTTRHEKALSSLRELRRSVEKLLVLDDQVNRRFMVSLGSQAPHNRRISFQFSVGTVNLALDSGLDTFQPWSGAGIKESTVVSQTSGEHIDDKSDDWSSLFSNRSNAIVFNWVNGKEAPDSFGRTGGWFQGFKITQADLR